MLLKGLEKKNPLRTFTQHKPAVTVIKVKNAEQSLVQRKKGVFTTFLQCDFIYFHLL